MQPLKTLPITAREIERYSSLEVSELFIGNVLRGIYRPSIFRSPQKLLAFGVTELALTALVFIFCLPLGFAVVRDKSLPWLFLTVTGTATGGVVLSRHLYRLRASQSLQPLMLLLDGVDQFNESVQTLVVLEQLETVQPGSEQLARRTAALEMLQLTRDNLVAGLRTEKILRDNWGLMVRRQELMASLETNLNSLEANLANLDRLRDLL